MAKKKYKSDGINSKKNKKERKSILPVGLMFKSPMITMARIIGLQTKIDEDK